MIGALSRSTRIRRISRGLNLHFGKVDPFQICKDPKLVGKEFDYAVIGGGSGGVSSAIKAAQLGLNTVLFDFVEPTAHGSKWGLGGTCVNVGCVPKKLFHNAGLLKEQVDLSQYYGWDLGAEDTHQFSWNTLVRNVNLHIKRTNFDMTKALSSSNIHYVNCLAAFSSPTTILYSPSASEIKHFATTGEIRDPSKVGELKAKYSLISVGGRPNLLSEEECPGAHLAITSDDIFMKKEDPGRTLIIGSGYIGVEVASLLHKLGYDVTLMARSVLLRTFDQGVVQRLRSFMVDKFGIDCREGMLPNSIKKKENGRLEVEIKLTDSGEVICVEEYDTVLMAISRTPLTNHLGLKHAGVEINKRSKKIKGGHDSQMELTSSKSIYAIGDVLDGAPELTPTATMSGVQVAKKVAKNLGKYEGKIKELDFSVVPTTVFSYPEYSTVGLSEGQAIKEHGAENIEVYHLISTPLEENLNTAAFPDESPRQIKSYFKLVTLSDEKKTILGMHFLGLHAGEVMQGFGVYK